MQNIAIITAAGSGKRLGGSTKKQYLELGGKPLLYYTIRQFEAHPAIESIVLVAPQDDLEYVRQEIVEQFGFHKIIKIIAGGQERQDSIFNALQSLADYPAETRLLIHDGVRPFITSDVLDAVIEKLKQSISTVVGVRVKDTIKEIDSDIYTQTLDRSRLIAVQTPQAFTLGLLAACYNLAQKENFYSTDDAALVEKYGLQSVHLTAGSYFNIKITTAEDLIFAEAILNSLRENSCYHL